MASLAEAQSPNVSPATFLSHYRTLRDLGRTADEARMALTRAKKAAKADGIDLSALKIVEKLRKLDEDEAEIVVRHSFQYSDWLGQPMGTQASLFPEQAAQPGEKASAEHQEWVAAETGYTSGKGGKLRGDNPFPEGSPLYAQWDKGFLRGLKILAAQLRSKEDLAADRKTDKAKISQVSDEPDDVLTMPTPRRGRRPASDPTTPTAH